MRQIIALGGGGFSMEPNNPLLDRYVLAQARRDPPRVCFVPTASGDAAGYIERFYESFRAHPCVPTHLSLFQPSFTDLAAFVLEQDVISAGGGNTRNLLALWREWGLDQVLRRAWQDGVVLAGLSAGSICWYEEGLSDSSGAGYTTLRGLGFLPGSHCPHYSNEPGRRDAYRQLIASGALGGGLAADDGVAFHHIGDALAKVVSSRPDAGAYRVSNIGGAVEEPLAPQLLGA